MGRPETYNQWQLEISKATILKVCKLLGLSPQKIYGINVRAATAWEEIRSVSYFLEKIVRNEVNRLAKEQKDAKAKAKRG